MQGMYLATRTHGVKSLQILLLELRIQTKQEVIQTEIIETLNPVNNV